MSVVRSVLGLLVAGALLAGLSALTRVPYEPRVAGPVLRLSWRTRGETMERCRRATARELAGVEAHMRQEVICEGKRVAPYRLHVRVDSQTIVDGLAPGSGVPGERPMYVLRDIPLQPGSHRIAVLLERQGEEVEHDELEAYEHRRRAIPPRLTLDTAVMAQADAILLVTYDPDTRALVLRAPGSRR